VHDGIELELRGIPAAVVCTVPFENMGRSTARIRGLADYPFAVVAHPLGRLDGSGVEERVGEAVEPVEALLLRGRTED
jgi:hypothetical protein